MTNAPKPSSANLPAKLPRIGLALGGGGARGLAHLAIIEALDEMGLKPAVIAGTSIGAIFGAGLAAGLSGRYMRAHIEEVLSEKYALARQLFSARAPAVSKLFNLFPLRQALLDAEVLLELVLPTRLPERLEQLALPLAVVATDFYAEEPVVMRQGPLKQAVGASIALPVIFHPVTIEGRALLDGGLVDPLPFDLVREGADITIAVDVSGAQREPEHARGPKAFEALLSASLILQRSIVREKLKSHRPDILIDPTGERFGVLEFHRFAEILAAAEPVKDAFKRKLERALTSATVEPRAIE
ncbi:MAG: patatin-like phospholipase family protein [Proteobacteria bacterium]|nr:patatin-like phospholipase family protein [Pseudomonadota bacterium]